MTSVSVKEPLSYLALSNTIRRYSKMANKNAAGAREARMRSSFFLFQVLGIFVHVSGPCDCLHFVHDQNQALIQYITEIVRGRGAGMV